MTKMITALRNIECFPSVNKKTQKKTGTEETIEDRLPKRGVYELNDILWVNHN